MTAREPNVVPPPFVPSILWELRRPRLWLFTLVFVLTASRIGDCQQRATKSSPAADLASDAILVEMQRLRQAVERSGILNAEALITTHRAAMEQRRIDSLSGQEFYVRQQIALATADQAKAESAIRAWQSRIAETPNPNSPLYWQYQEAVTALRSDADRAASLLQQYRNWREEIASALRAEQTKVNDILDRLNKIESSLADIPANHPER